MVTDEGSLPAVEVGEKRRDALTHQVAVGLASVAGRGRSLQQDRRLDRVHRLLGVENGGDAGVQPSGRGAADTAKSARRYLERKGVF
jgi:hypothetical protein